MKTGGDGDGFGERCDRLANVGIEDANNAEEMTKRSLVPRKIQLARWERRAAVQGGKLELRWLVQSVARLQGFVRRRGVSFFVVLQCPNDAGRQINCATTATLEAGSEGKSRRERASAN